MAKLLCVCPSPSLTTHYGRLAANLVPRWSTAFTTIDLWCTYGPAPDLEAFPVERAWASEDAFTSRLGQLGETISNGEYTHVLLVGDLKLLQQLAGLGLVRERLPNTLLYAYAIVETSFIDTAFLQLPQCFDFFVFLAEAGLEAYSGLLDEVGRSILDKNAFRAAQSATFIRPGVTATFSPPNVHGGEPSKEEIREAMFGGKVTGKDILVMVSGRKTRHKGLPQACATVAALRELLPNNSVKAYFHMPAKPDAGRSLNLLAIAEGNDLVSHQTALYGDGFFAPGTPPLPDEDLRLLYSAADVFLSADLANGWLWSATEAAACGTLIAVPDEHVGLEIAGKHGIMLPCDIFNWSPWNHTEYVRSTSPHRNARLIADVLADTKAVHTRREEGIAWAQRRENSWDNTATQWLELFGVA